MTSYCPLCCSSFGSPPTATQDRLAPGSSVKLFEFGVSSSAGSRSRFLLDLIVVADDHCCLYPAIAVIRFCDRIQSRSPPGKEGGTLCARMRASMFRPRPRQGSVGESWRSSTKCCEALVDCVRPSKVVFFFLAWHPVRPTLHFLQSSDCHCIPAIKNRVAAS